MKWGIAFSIALVAVIGSVARAAPLKSGDPIYYSEDHFVLNEIPVAVVSGDQDVSPNTFITVDGSESFDPEAQPITFRWSFDVLPQGSNAEISDPTAPVVTFTADIPGLYLLKLQVNDGVFNSEPAYAAIRVAAPNQPPVVGALAYLQVSDGFPATYGFSLLSSSDPDGQITSYEYDFGDGRRTVLNKSEDPDGLASVVHVYEAAGTYTASITAVDNFGARTTASVVVNVSENSRPIPKISADVISGPTPLTVNFDATQSTDLDGQIVSYRWLWGDGSPEQSGAQLTNPTRTFNTPGIYRVRLRVIDDKNARTTSFLTIFAGVSVPAGSPPPSTFIRVSDTYGAAPLTVTFDATHSFDLNGAVTSVHWTYNDPFSFQTGDQGAQVTHTFENPGYYSVSATATDAFGNSDTQFVDILVGDGGPAPTPRAVAFNGGSLRRISLDSSQLTIPGPAPSFNTYWDFGDGTRANANRFVSKTYNAPGVYTVTLATIDALGRKKVSSSLVTVRNDGKFPAAQFNPNLFVFPAGQSVELASTSVPTIEGDLEYRWFFGDGATLSGFGSSFAEPSHQFSQGRYQTTLYVRDEEGRSAATARTISATVSSPPEARMRLSQRVGVVPLTVNFDATPSYDSDGTIALRHINFGDNNDFRRNDETASQAAHTYRTPGTYIARVSAKDSSGDVTDSFEKIVVLNAGNPANQAPTADFNFTLGANGVVSFNGGLSADPDNNIQFYEWDFGDGRIDNFENLATVEHQFTAPGNYDVTLKVIDSFGATHFRTQTLSPNFSTKLSDYFTLAYWQERFGKKRAAARDGMTPPPGSWEADEQARQDLMNREGCYENNGVIECYGGGGFGGM